MVDMNDTAADYAVGLLEVKAAYLAKAPMMLNGFKPGCGISFESIDSRGLNRTFVVLILGDFLSCQAFTNLSRDQHP